MAKAKRKSNSQVKVNVMNCGHGHWHAGSCGGGVYGLGFLGALVYYLQTSTGFWNGVLGVLKALVWPAFVVYKLLGF